MIRKMINIIILAFVTLIILSGCRLKLGDYEISCDDESKVCTTSGKTSNGTEEGSSNEENSSYEEGDSTSNTINYDPSNTKPGTFVADNAGGPAECGSTYNLRSPSRGIFGSFSYYDSDPNNLDNRWSLQMCPEWRRKNLTSVSTTCSDGTKYKWTVNVKAVSTFKKVQEKFCEFITTGVNGIVYKPSDIDVGGPTVIRFESNYQTGIKNASLHSYGIAIDINSSKSYYGRDREKYNNFVKKIGSESDPRNINFILWKVVFQPLGFNWGGNWPRYDGMHFEIDWSQTK